MAWEFGEEASFDGVRLFAEVNPENAGRIRTGTLEILAAPGHIHRATVFAHGAPGLDAGAFSIVLTNGGAIRLACTEKDGTPFRLKTPDRFVRAKDRIQITLSSGLGGRFSVVNLSRLQGSPNDPATSFVEPMPLRARCDLRGQHGFTFGAASGGKAPFFEGRIHMAAVSDTIDNPSVAPVAAKVHHVDFRARQTVSPRRILPRDDNYHQPARPAPDRRRDGISGMLIATSEGDVPINKLLVGQEVLTRTSGFQRVAWIGRSALSWASIRAKSSLQPILVRKDHLGPGLPDGDMLLAPQERLLVPGAALRDRGPAADGFIPAIDLPAGQGGLAVDSLGVTYVHFFCEQTETVQINGLWCEALNPFDVPLNGPQRARRAELFSMFPSLINDAEGATS